MIEEFKLTFLKNQNTLNGQ